MAGMAAGDDAALVLLRHPGITRAEIAEVLGSRWPDAAVVDVGARSPSWPMTAHDAAELARARRGVEPLRILVLAQRAASRARVGQERAASPPVVEPMPFVL